MRIFAVAPRMGAGSGILAVEEELAAFVQYHEVEPQIPLIDYVADLDIAHEVNLAGECAMFAVLSHADANGVLLSDDTYLDAETIGQYARVLEAKYIYLNTCNSALFVNRLALITRCSIIYTAAEVTDNEAIRFGILFAKELAETGSVEDAFKRVAPRDRKYRFYKAKPEDMTTEELRQITELKQAIYELKIMVQAEIRILQERHELNQKMIETMRAQIDTMPKMVETMRAQIDAMQKFTASAIPPQVIISFGLLALSVVIIMVVLFWR